MNEVLMECSGGVLRIQLNRPTKKNALTVTMYAELAEVFEGAMADPDVRVALWHGAGDAFCAGNDIEDFLRNPPGPAQSPQARLMNALVDFEKPLVAAVHGAAIGGGTTMLTHCDFVYAGQGTRFQMPFVNLALVPEFGSSFSIPAMAGYIRAAELILLGSPFDAAHAAAVGLVTRVVSDRDVFSTAAATAHELASKSAAALRACKKLMKRPVCGRVRAAMEAENMEFSAQVRSADAREALTAFVEKRPPNFARTGT
jgi:enoyl-CoA hydratase/carnithine racemase